jgi:hypothetical protein
MLAGGYLKTTREGGFVAEQKSVYSARPPEPSDRRREIGDPGEFIHAQKPMQLPIGMSRDNLIRINCHNNDGTLPQPAENPLVNTDPLFFQRWFMLNKIQYMDPYKYSSAAGGCER